MTYEQFLKTKFSNNKKLLVDGKPCEFVEHDECHGMIVVRFEKPINKKKTSFFEPYVPIYSLSVHYEQIETNML